MPSKKDYGDEYEKHLRCRTCNRKCNGPEDFKNIKTGNPVKTCIKCRTTILKSWYSKPRPKAPPQKPEKKKITQKQKVEILDLLIHDMDKEQIDYLIEKHPYHEITLRKLIQ